MSIVKQLKEIASQVNVLYVEDDTDIAKTLTSYLSKFFKEVVYAKNGQDGLELYKQDSYDLVITDIKMPKMDGLEMSEEIKKINSSQNIIIISAYSEIENFLKSIKIGVDGYILKPVDYADMNELLLKIVNKINLQKDNDTYLKRVSKLIEELKQKNDELHHYTEAINKVAIVSKTDLKGYITFVNDFFCDICGYSREELMGANHNIIRHPDVPKSIFKDMWDTIQSGKTWEGDVKNRCKNGEPYYVKATIIPLFEVDGVTIREYIGIRFLTTDNEKEKRKFKKEVILTYQELRREDYKNKQRIEELEKEILTLKSMDYKMQDTSDKQKKKTQQLSSQINYYENEIKKINAKYEKILKINSDNNKKLADSYKKALSVIDNKTQEIEKLKGSDKILRKDIDYLNDLVAKQRKFNNDLRDTIKNLREDNHEEIKKGILDKLL